MKKHYKLLLIMIIALYVPFSAFNTVKAESMTYATSGTFDEGYYTVYGLQANSNGYIQFYAFDKFYSYDQYKTAVITEINLDASYTGDITLNIPITWQNMPLFWVECDAGSCAIEAYQKTFILRLQDCMKLTVFWASTQTSINSIQPTSVVSNLYETSEINNVIDVINNVGDYQLPIESLMAYIFTTSVSNPVVFNSGNIAPYIKVDNGSQTRNATYTYQGSTSDPRLLYHFVFIANVNLGVNDIVPQNNLLHMTINRPATFNWGNYSLYDLTFYVDHANSPVTTRLSYFRTIYMYPLYYGLGSPMPNNIKALIGMQTEHEESMEYLQWIQMNLDDILYLLSQDQTQDDAGFIHDMSHVIDDYSQSEDVIHDYFNDAISNIDLDDYSIPASLSATTNWLISQMENIVYLVPDMRILFTLPLVLGIALFFIGRGSVIFRQGNIDRARETAYIDELSALHAVDKENSDRANMAFQKLSNNNSRMEYHHTSSRLHDRK